MIKEITHFDDDCGDNTQRNNSKAKSVDIPRICFESLEKFQRTPKPGKPLKQATLSIIANFLFPDKSVLLNIFRFMDESDHGQLGADELKFGFEQILGKSITDEKLNEIVEQVNGKEGKIVDKIKRGRNQRRNLLDLGKY